MSAHQSVAADQAAHAPESEGRGPNGEGGSAELLRRRDPLTQVCVCLPMVEMGRLALTEAATRLRDAGLESLPTLQLARDVDRHWYALKHLGEQIATGQPAPGPATVPDRLFQAASDATSTNNTGGGATE